ncbi:MAG: hypothetical protein LQ351_005539 [Letrouitia transgressa]|nr:MAG: hypothetical protein LQ351_005539 [Letrouitia transgressa]
MNYPKRKLQIVWPQDKNQRGPRTWNRLKDILTGKGPDMWIARQGDIGPTRPLWSHWGRGPGNHHYGNLGYYDDRHRMGPGWRFGRRPQEKKYNFHTRRYEYDDPDCQRVCDIKWDRDGHQWLYRMDEDGGESLRHGRVPEDLIEEWEYYGGVNPFAKDLCSPTLPWKNDVQLDW